MAHSGHLRQIGGRRCPANAGGVEGHHIAQVADGGVVGRQPLGQGSPEAVAGDVGRQGRGQTFGPARLAQPGEQVGAVLEVLVVADAPGVEVTPDIGQLPGRFRAPDGQHRGPAGVMDGGLGEAPGGLAGLELLHLLQGLAVGDRIDVVAEAGPEVRQQPFPLGVIGAELPLGWIADQHIELLPGGEAEGLEAAGALEGAIDAVTEVAVYGLTIN